MSKVKVDLYFLDTASNVIDCGASQTLVSCNLDKPLQSREGHSAINKKLFL